MTFKYVLKTASLAILLWVVTWCMIAVGFIAARFYDIAFNGAAVVATLMAVHFVIEELSVDGYV